MTKSGEDSTLGDAWSSLNDALRHTLSLINRKYRQGGALTKAGIPIAGSALIRFVPQSWFHVSFPSLSNPILISLNAAIVILLMALFRRVMRLEAGIESMSRDLVSDGGSENQVGNLVILIMGGVIGYALTQSIAPEWSLSAGILSAFIFFNYFGAE